ncbi:hypothetical protein BYI23_B000590 [Burkholderia sp. YI23]|nr:hypothetical protein BYI23_B000590 [Burkholderia sp. YI23]
MERTQHPSNNAVLGAPQGWDQKQLPCGALPITRIEHEGVEHVVSFWRPSADELAALNNGGLVALWVVGTTHPPLSIAVEPK